MATAVLAAAIASPLHAVDVRECAVLDEDRSRLFCYDAYATHDSTASQQAPEARRCAAMANGRKRLRCFDRFAEANMEAEFAIRLDEAKDEAVNHCLATMQSFGLRTMELCVYREVRALEEVVEKASGQHNAIIKRCKLEIGERGWSMVKACVNMDIEAQAALSNYDARHRPIIERCERQRREWGWYSIMKCADRAIERQ